MLPSFCTNKNCLCLKLAEQWLFQNCSFPVDHPVHIVHIQGWNTVSYGSKFVTISEHASFWSRWLTQNLTTSLAAAVVSVLRDECRN